MAWQLIYTSAPRGLVAGRSGFCTVARHREIRDALVTAIERVSQYERSSRSSIGPAIHPVIYSHRVIAVGSSVYHVLSRIRDAGADYTGRTNHIAHHLICEQHELSAAPSPADILLQMPWPDTAPETPRFFTDKEVIKLSHFHTSLKLPAENWRQLTGDAGCAALPLEGGALGGCYWIHQPETDQRLLLKLFAESLLLLNPRGNTREKLWLFPFTTYVQSSDGPADFLWRGCWPEGQAMLSATRGSKQLIDLTQARLLAAPQNSITEFARSGRATFDAPSLLAQVPEFEDGVPLSVDAIGAPAASAASGEELDIESLIAKADECHRGKETGLKPKYFFIIGLATVLALGLAFFGYQGWQRAAARNAIKLATEEEIFRLKGIEERPVRAAASVYRTGLEKARYWSQIKDHPEIKKKIGALDQWEESEKQLDDIEKDSGSAQLAGLALEKIKKLESDFDALPPGYKRVVDARRDSASMRTLIFCRLASTTRL